MTRRECEVLVIGAGPAGIAAACCASESGRTVVLADESPSAGGQIWRAEPNTSHQYSGKSKSATAWLARLARSGVSNLHGATAFDGDATLRLVRFERESELIEIRYHSLIIATGARERFVPFPGWTLPGVYGVGGLQALVKGGFPVDRRRIVVAGTGPLLLAAAGMLGTHGAEILMLLEQASWRSLVRFGSRLAAYPGKVVEAVSMMGQAGVAPFRPGWWVSEAGGEGRVEWAALTNGERTVRVDCDMLACGYGLVPNSEFARFLGCETTCAEGCPGGHFVQVDGQQRTSVEGIFACGEITGIGGAELSLAEGSIAGGAASGCMGKSERDVRLRERYSRLARAIDVEFALRTELRKLIRSDTIICRCEDVRAAELSGFASWREAKLASRCGMGPCQGRTCGPAAEFLFGWRQDGVRPPASAVRLKSLAGPGNTDARY